MSILSIKAEEPAELDFLIFSYEPTEQLVINEIIESAESLGFVVNPIYINDWNYFTYLILGTNDWDLYYGGYMNTYAGAADNIFNCAYGNMGYNYYYLRPNDAKYIKFSLQLWGMLQAYLADPSIADASFIDDMYDKFYDCEERLWEKQLIIPLAECVVPDGRLMQKILVPNCLPGYALNDVDIRLAFSQAIERAVVVDYLLGFGFTDVNIIYHTFGYSVCHDTTLPNCLPN